MCHRRHGHRCCRAVVPVGWVVLPLPTWLLHGQLREARIKCTTRTKVLSMRNARAFKMPVHRCTPFAKRRALVCEMKTKRAPERTDRVHQINRKLRGVCVCAEHAWDWMPWNASNASMRAHECPPNARVYALIRRKWCACVRNTTHVKVRSTSRSPLIPVSQCWLCALGAQWAQVTNDYCYFIHVRVFVYTLRAFAMRLLLSIRHSAAAFSSSHHLHLLLLLLVAA